jgi:2-C-methyl-D-erythritol 4-phosphate cytidylyltransferase
MSNNPSPSVWAAIAAAGTGSRLNASMPKQYVSINGRSMAEHTLRALLGVAGIREITVAIAADDRHWNELPATLRERVRVVCGGTDRAESVWRAISGFSAVPRENDWILVHDMARPCITRKLVESLMETLRDDPVGGLLAIPVADTLKRADGGGHVVATLERGELWRAQTPQMFRYTVLVRALRHARDNGIACSDEAMAVESIGLQPRLVTGSEQNLKVTVAEDLPLAEYYLARGHGETA